MPVISLIVTTVATSAQGFFKKYLNERCKKSEFTVSAMITFFALLFFVVFSRDIKLSPDFLPYSAAYGVCYACAAVTYVLALNYGSLALTQLVIAYSCVIPLAYSLMCGETLGVFRIIGILFLFSSLIVTYYRKEKGDKESAISLKWVILVVLMFISNGMCGVLSRMQQLKFSGIYDNSFMLASLILATLLISTAAIIRERKTMTEAIWRGALFSFGSGLSNGIANYFGLIALALVPNAVVYPVKSAGGLVLTALMSIFIFKEKLRVAQYVGVGLGILAMIFINIT